MSFIGMFMVLVILGILYSRQTDLFFRSSRKKPAEEAAKAALPEQALIVAWNMEVSQMEAAVSSFEAQNGAKPSSLVDLQRATGVASTKDPWGGRFYIQNGWLRCTGNPKAAHRLW